MVAPNRQWAATLNLVDTTLTTARVAPGTATQRVTQFVNGLQVQNKHATTAAVLSLFAGATAIWKVNLPAAQAAAVVLPQGFLLNVGAGNDLKFQLSAAGDVLIDVQGFDGTDV